MSGGVVDLPAILITLAITWILFVGVRESAKFNNIIVVIKILVILLFIFLGVRHINLANLHPLMPFGWKGVMAGAAIIFFPGYHIRGFDLELGVSTRCPPRPKRPRIPSAMFPSAS